MLTKMHALRFNVLSRFVCTRFLIANVQTLPGNAIAVVNYERVLFNQGLADVDDFYEVLAAPKTPFLVHRLGLKPEKPQSCMFCHQEQPSLRSFIKG